MAEYDVVIVGCGPAGSFIASELGKKGVNVLATDMKEKIGKNACSGLISTRIESFFKLPSYLVEHKIRGARFHSKHERVKLKRKNIQAYVINRPEFDRWLFEHANKHCETKLGFKFVDYRIKSDRIESCFLDRKGKKVIISSKLLVGADGAASRVRKVSGLEGNLTRINAALGYVDREDYDECVDLYFDNSIAYGFFAWKIPRGEKLELGLGCEGANAVKNLEIFARKLKLKLKKVHAHPIVMGMQETASSNLLLVGDAAAQVKPFSGGGIIYGLMCAKIATGAIVKSLEINDYSADFLRKEYDEKWKRVLLEKIRIGMAIRNFLKHLNTQEMDEIILLLKEQKEAILKFADMDFL